MSRHTLANTLRLVRGALGACARADVRYGHAADVELRLRQVRRALLDAERQLRFAVRDALDARRARVERRRAA